MKKNSAIILTFIAYAILLFSCGSKNHNENKNSTPEILQEKPKEVIVEDKWQPVHFEFNPMKIEVIDVSDNKKYVSWPGEGGTNPSLMNSFFSRIELRDSLDRIYLVTIDGYQILKNWHNAESDKDLIDKNLNKNFDSTDTYTPSKKAYDKIINAKAGEIRILVDTFYKGGSPKIMVISGQKLIQKKIGNAYLKGQYDNILHTK